MNHAARFRAIEGVRQTDPDDDLDLGTVERIRSRRGEPAEEERQPLPATLHAVQWTGTPAEQAKETGSPRKAHELVIADPGFIGCDVGTIKCTKIGDETKARLADGPTLRRVIEVQRTRPRGAWSKDPAAVARRVALFGSIAEPPVKWSAAAGVQPDDVDAEACRVRALALFLADVGAGACGLSPAMTREVLQRFDVFDDCEEEITDGASGLSQFVFDSLGANADRVAEEQERQRAEAAAVASEARAHAAERVTVTPNDVIGYVLEPGPSLPDGARLVDGKPMFLVSRGRWPFALVPDFWISAGLAGARRAQLVTEPITLTRGELEQVERAPLHPALAQRLLDAARQRPECRDPIARFVDMRDPSYAERERILVAVCKRLGAGARSLDGPMPTAEGFAFASIAVRALRIRPALAAQIANRSITVGGGAPLTPRSFRGAALGQGALCGPDEGLDDLRRVYGSAE